MCGLKIDHKQDAHTPRSPAKQMEGRSKLNMESCSKVGAAFGDQSVRKPTRPNNAVCSHQTISDSIGKWQ